MIDKALATLFAPFILIIVLYLLVWMSQALAQ